MNNDLKTLLLKTLKSEELILVQSDQHFRLLVLENYDYSSIIKYKSLSKTDKIVDSVLDRYLNAVEQKIIKLFDEFTIQFNDKYENCSLSLILEAKCSDQIDVASIFIKLFGQVRLATTTSYQYFLKMGELRCYLDPAEVEDIYSILNDINNKNIEQENINNTNKELERITISKKILKERLDI